MLVDLYRRWLFEVWGAGDYAVADEVLAADLVDHNPSPGQPAGRAGDVWAARMVRAAFPDAAFTLDVAFESGDLVTGRWTMTGTHRGPLALLGLPAARPDDPPGRPAQRLAAPQGAAPSGLTQPGPPPGSAASSHRVVRPRTGSNLCEDTRRCAKSRPASRAPRCSSVTCGR